MNSPAEVQVRRMSAEDVERVLEIAGGLPEAPQWPASAYVAAMDAELRPRRIALVAEYASESPRTLEREPLSVPAPHQDRSQVIGFLMANVVPPETELETVAVAEEAQRHGIGGLLLGALIQILRMDPVDTLVLEVRASNRKALNFYQENGLREIGRRPRYYADPEEDAILMRLNLA